MKAWTRLGNLECSVKNVWMNFGRWTFVNICGMSRNRIVLDTNSLVQCIAPRSRYRRIWDSYVEGDYVLCVSNEILNEYEEILERLAGVEVSKYAIEAILNSSNTLFCVPSYNFHLIEADPDDNKFVDCAVATGATCIVTEDHHSSVLNKIDFPKIVVVGIDTFLHLL